MAILTVDVVAWARELNERIMSLGPEELARIVDPLYDMYAEYVAGNVQGALDRLGNVLSSIGLPSEVLTSLKAFADLGEAFLAIIVKIVQMIDAVITKKFLDIMAQRLAEVMRERSFEELRRQLHLALYRNGVNGVVEAFKVMVDEGVEALVDFVGREALL